MYSSKDVEDYSEPILSVRPKCPYCFLKGHICTVRERRRAMKGICMCVKGMEEDSSLVCLPQGYGHLIGDQQEQVHQQGEEDQDIVS